MSRIPSRYSDDELAEGIDLKALLRIKKRFLALNQERLQQLRAACRERARQFLDLLPLLLHAHHPLLPGYTRSGAPHAIAAYTPAANSLRAARRLAKSFSLEARPHPRPAIDALFLMGSAGSLAQTGDSDFDIWVVQRPDLDESERDALQERLERIRRYAADEDIEAHLFLMHPDHFRAPQPRLMNRDASGSSQHFLLLDEFYRTALLLAGKPPLWWLIPPEQEAHYQQYSHNLLHKRYLKAQDFVDFGGLSTLPADEFLGAALWQLYKAIDSPYKSTLKLLLMESYARSWPAPRPLSLSFKAQIYASAALDRDELDPYVMMLRRIEGEPANQANPERLQLLRRCLYLKTEERLSLPGGAAPSWRRARLARLVVEWGWSPEQLVELDSRRRWKARYAMAERKRLVAELTASYRFLASFARQHGELARITAEDIALLGRKLYASFERRAGKLEFINPHVAPDLSEDRLCFGWHGGPEPGWLLWAGQAGSPDSALRRGAEFLELLVWARCNGLLIASTQTILEPGSPLPLQEFQALCRHALSELPCERTLPSDAAFKAPPVRVAVQIFLNLSLSPSRERGRNQATLISSRNDALAYGDLPQNLVQRIDSITFNSWQEVLLHHELGPQAVLAFLSRWAQEQLHDPDRPALQVHCYAGARASAIARRIEILLGDLGAALRQHGKALRYLLEFGGGYALLQTSEQGVHVTALPDQDVLRAALAEPQSRFRAWVIDRGALLRSVLPPLLTRHRAGQLRVISTREAEQTVVYVLDEMGALFRWNHAHPQALAQLKRFLDASCLRQDACGQAPLSIGFFELRAATSGWQLLRTPPPPDEPSSPPFEVQAISTAQGGYVLYCDGQSFNPDSRGETPYAALARYVLTRRPSAEPYPIYLSDLDLSACYPEQALCTGHYLLHKLELEAALNAAQKTSQPIPPPPSP